MIKISCNTCDGIYDSLDVRFTKKCDNSCSFCIENSTAFPDLGNTTVQKLIAQTIYSGITSVLVLGGEPFLSPGRLLRYVKGIRPYVKTIYVTTSLPQSMAKHPTIVSEVLTIIDGLNVSLQHYDWKENNKILQASSPYNRIAYLQKLIHENGSDKIRVAINLVKGAVDSKYTLERFFYSMYRIRVSTVKINELCHSEETYVSYEKIMDVKLKAPYAYGCQTQINYPYDMTVILKRSCFITESTLQASFSDLVKVLLRKLFGKFLNKGNRFAVLYENGDIYTDWQKGEKHEKEKHEKENNCNS